MTSVPRPLDYIPIAAGSVTDLLFPDDREDGGASGREGKTCPAMPDLSEYSEYHPECFTALHQPGPPGGEPWERYKPPMAYDYLRIGLAARDGRVFVTLEAHEDLFTFPAIDQIREAVLRTADWLMEYAGVNRIFFKVLVRIVETDDGAWWTADLELSNGIRYLDADKITAYAWKVRDTVLEMVSSADAAGAL